MNRPALLLAGALGLAAAGPAPAQEASPSPEPQVQRTVVDDGGTRIEELRVRGQLQRVTVAPKGKARPYEILTGEGPHGVADGTSAARGAAGQRVWHLLSF